MPVEILDDEFWVCNDCAAVLANNDRTGVEEEDADRIDQALKSFSKNNPGVDIVSNSLNEDEEEGAGDDEFQWRDCELCGGPPGMRVRFALLQRV